MDALTAGFESTVDELAAAEAHTGCPAVCQMLEALQRQPCQQRRMLHTLQVQREERMSHMYAGRECCKAAPELWQSGRGAAAQEQAGDGQGGCRCSCSWSASFKAHQASLLSQASPAVWHPSEEAFLWQTGPSCAHAVTLVAATRYT